MYSIKAVSNLTGLTTDTLRAWERRYQAVEPRREPNGRRYYTEDDVARLQLLRRAAESGHPIRNIAGRTEEELRRLLSLEPAAPAAGNDTGALAEALTRALTDWNSERFEKTLAVAAATLELDDLAESVLAPVTREVGERWSRGELSIAQERIASTAVRKLILAAANTLKPLGTSRSIVLATLPGERHELGILMAGLIASSRQFACHYVGTDLPVEEVVRSAKAHDAIAVGIGIVVPAEPIETIAQLRHLCDGLGPAVPVYLGGAGARRLDGHALPANCHIVGDLREFGDRLQMLGPPARRRTA